MNLNGKVAIVTGSGGGGSGRAVALRLAREGAAVVVNDIHEAGGLETVRLIEQSNGDAAFHLADASNEKEIAGLIGFAETKFGGLDVLVNNASHTALDGFLTGWAHSVQVELLGPMYATQYAIEAMRRRGGGAIVNIGSTSTIGHGRKHSQWPGYDVAKMGVMRLSTTLAPLAKENIRVNCFVPSWVASPDVKTYWEGLTADQRKARGAPDTLLSVEEFADAVFRLITDDSLAGRILIWWNGEPPRLIPQGDQGYERLEDLTS